MEKAWSGWHKECTGKEFVGRVKKKKPKMKPKIRK